VILMKIRKQTVKCKYCGTETAYFFESRIVLCRNPVCMRLLMIQTKLLENVSHVDEKKVVVEWA